MLNASLYLGLFTPGPEPDWSTVITDKANRLMLTVLSASLRIIAPSLERVSYAYGLTRNDRLSDYPEHIQPKRPITHNLPQA
eukprot:scaffold513722_cov14-Prasinocladus_malaysianus.AAC.1